MPQLLVVHVGPVQSFIVNARRSRDLWFGSWVLSELSKAVAHDIAAVCGKEALVFPAPRRMSDLQPGSDLKVANRVVAYLPDEPIFDPTQIASAVQDRLREIATDTFDRIGSGTRMACDYDRSGAEAQVTDLPEVFWVMRQCDAGTYDGVRRYLEGMMAARKSTREFAQPTSWASHMPKSSMDGQRESVIPEGLYRQDGDSSDEVLRKERDLYRCFRARPAERLSGVDLLKRLGNPSGQSSFPSTSHMAARPLIRRLQQAALNGTNVADLATEYVKTLRGETVGLRTVEELSGPFGFPELASCDGSILFENRVLEEERLTTEQEERARSALRTFLKESLGAEGLTPSPYYALLQGDGDFMGSVIDNQTEVDQHRQFSEALSGFAGKVRTIVDAFDGALVYAGGDDVLAFLPLDTAVNCARTVADAFKQDMAAFQDAEGRRPTFSAGLVIAHHLESLRETMELARSAERAAKAVGGKDALAVVLSKRSGVDREVKGHWDALCGRLEEFVRLSAEDTLPSGAAYDLNSVMVRLDNDSVPSLDEVRILETRRILERKRSEHGKATIDKDLASDITIHARGPGAPSVGQLAAEMIVASFLAQARALSGIKDEELATRSEAVLNAQGQGG